MRSGTEKERNGAEEEGVEEEDEAAEAEAGEWALMMAESGTVDGGLEAGL